MALGDRRRAEAIRATRQEAGQEETIKRTVIEHPPYNKKKRLKKIRSNFSLRTEEREVLTELTDLLHEKSDSELLGKLIMRAKKVASDPEFNRHQTDIFDFL
ncbi:hypothetical protein ABLU29_07825 [Lactococcus lactis]|uniref:hypothetical protein n=1 Tax=Lactococcus lactis TaxID=1358 RepID=UPI003878429E